MVIDNSGYVPRHVRLSAELLAPKVKQYVFVSSISVYPNFSVPRDENLAGGQARRRDRRESGRRNLRAAEGAVRAGGARRRCRAAPPSSGPGLIVGPDDNTDRFTYWPARAARGGEFIAPGAPHDPFQVIDARDLAAFTINAIENNITGTYNLVSNVNEFKFGELTDACIACGEASRRSRPMRRAPPIYPRSSSRSRRSSRGAKCPCGCRPRVTKPRSPAPATRRRVAKGLKITPLKKTVDDTLAWHLTRPAEEREKLKAGIAPEKEADGARGVEGEEGLMTRRMH